MNEQDKKDINEVVSTDDSQEAKKDDFFTNDQEVVALPKKGLNLLAILGMVVGLVVVVLGVAAGLLYGAKNDSQFVRIIATELHYPLAMVENRFVPMTEYWQALDLVKKNCELVGTNCQITDEDKKSAVKNLIDERLVMILADKEGVKVEQSELDDQYNKIVEQNGGADEFAKVVREKLNWSTDEFKSKLLISLYAQKLEEKVVEKVSAKHILIAVDQGASDEDVNKAKDKANEVIKKINEGADFTEVAKEYSDDPSVSQNGGDLGYFSRGMMVPDFEKAAFALNIGQISEPVRTDYGWHVIKVEGKTGSVKSSFSDWLEEQKKQMKIWYFYKVPGVDGDVSASSTESDQTSAAGN